MTSSTIVARLPVDDWAIRSPACLSPTFRPTEPVVTLQRKGVLTDRDPVFQSPQTAKLGNTVEGEALPGKGG
ncbi:hypothetical protein GOC90_29825 [Sinorhizobium medicae]|uniref:hypothetical protein n=1 Tax=Sinorhizobium medicae TaxID=110321 RepID=UPI000FD88BAF|nr:hypothetical protein [Sinorhizobium medicae]MDX0549981.1 hypothetical protein [Sinorhizobium medicae]MDX0611569.1 hypothetical protein [Sinorhizobium medicae]MDX0647520.1 hypothetical protein [Sinorhizobium medicae]MDX0741744.1 hypothetical protein [Sinorhizobium medicae]MDX1066501.1 hypothetical protein [Sinorhizobium medicae]